MSLMSLFKTYADQIGSIQILILLINVLVHLFFAGGVARDAGRMQKLGQETAIVSGYLWAFATLIGGVWVAIGYWFIHHSNLTRAQLSKHS